MLFKRLAILCLTFFFYNCNQKDSIENNQLIIVLDAVIKHDDSLHIYYLNNESIQLSESKMFWLKVNGNKKNQPIKIKLPTNNKTKSIRIDFGNNPKNDKIILNKISLKYNKKTLELKGKEIYYYFNIDVNNTVIDNNSGVLSRKNLKDKKGPTIYPKGQKLFKKLKILYQSNE